MCISLLEFPPHPLQCLSLSLSFSSSLSLSLPPPSSLSFFVFAKPSLSALSANLTKYFPIDHETTARLSLLPPRLDAGLSLCAERRQRDGDASRPPEPGARGARVYETAAISGACMVCEGRVDPRSGDAGPAAFT